ncbi:MAG: hypothetical protein ABI593_04525 [Betaproteobacteria bacterium]
MFEQLKPMVTSYSYDEVPDWVAFDGVRRIERADYATTALRDQTDLTLVSGVGGTWVRTGHILRLAARAGSHSSTALGPKEAPKK